MEFCHFRDKFIFCADHEIRIIQNDVDMFSIVFALMSVHICAENDSSYQDGVS
jgi:hypothetical protein